MAMEIDVQLRWQPKITPYRLLVLLTTIVLGSVKAYAVSQKLDFVATSIEWVAGVVVFSILFILGLFEPDPPRLLTWLMVPDLVPIIFKIFSLNLPRYRSDEGQNNPEIYITGYRLLTSMIVACFGILKAYFTYKGGAGAANALDWSLGIIIASLLYFLGLYENNAINMMPRLFVVDYSMNMHHLLWISVYVIGACTALLINRAGATYGLGLLPSLPSSLELKELSEFSVNLVLFSFLFLAPYSVVVILGFRLLESGLEYMTVPLFYARVVLRAMFHRVGNLVFRCFPSQFWLQWISIPFPLIITIIGRIRRNGAVILSFFTLSTLTMGMSLGNLFNVFIYLGEQPTYHSPQFLKPLLALVILICNVPLFALTIFFLVGGVSCFFVDDIF